MIINNISIVETPEQAAIRLSKHMIAQGYSLEALHEYSDTGGQVIYYRIRLKHPDGKKWIRPMHKDSNDQYQLTEPDFKDGLKPLYGLVLINHRPNAVIYIVEGERVADRLNQFFSDQNVSEGYLAVTSGGASSAVTADWKPISNRHCILWPDNNGVGIGYIQQVSKALELKACSIQFIDIEQLELPEGGDYVDWIEKNSNAILEDFLALPYLSPVISKDFDLEIEKITAISLSELLNRVLPPRENILEPWLPKAGICMVYAERGIGKTFFALEVTMAIAYGCEFLSFRAKSPQRVLYIDGEMPANTMQERLSRIEHRMKINPDMIQPMFITPDLQFVMMPNLSTPEGQEMIAEHVEHADLIIVDNISTMCGFGKENDAESWLPIQQWVLQQRRQGKTVLFIHHAGKNGTQRGTSKREDILDTVIKLKRPSDYEASMGACFELHFEKARGMMGEDVTPIRCQLMEDGWHYESVETTNYQKVVELYKHGAPQKDIVEELDLSKSQVSKLVKRAKAQGDIHG